MAIRVFVRAKPDRSNLSLYYVDPESGREVSKSAGTNEKKAAERAAALWEAELQSHRGADGTRWEWFRVRFDDEHLSTLPEKTQKSYRTALNHFRRLVKLDNLSDVSAGTISTFKAALVHEKRPTSSIANYLTHLRAAFRWAERVGILREAPHVAIPSVRRRLLMRGRALTHSEYAAMLAACVNDSERRFLELLWLSGLRLEEALRLSWDQGPIRVRLDATPYPQITFEAEGHKSRQDDAVPIPPDLFAWLSRTPEDARTGRVAPFLGRRGKPMRSNKVSVRISAIGRAAGIVVNEHDKAASAHDLRRSFGRRWAERVRPATLQRMMRHAEFSTTLKYYSGLTSADAGADLWGATGPKNGPKIDPNWSGIG